MKVTIPPIHPLAELIPAMDDAEYAALVEDIRANGLREPITLHEGKILDGRHRARACAELGIEPKYIDYKSLSDDDTPAAYVISLNVKRRHLEKSLLAVIALEFLPHLKAEGRERQREGQRKGGEVRGEQLAGRSTHKLHEPRDVLRSRDEAGKMVGVSGELVGVADRVRRERPDLYEEVKRGERTINNANAEIKRAANKRTEILSNAAVRRMGEICGSLNGTMKGLEEINVSLAAALCSKDVVRGWIRILETVDRVCRNARKMLTEEVAR